MPKLKMTGHDKKVRKYVSAEDLKKRFGNSKGYFDSEFEWDDSGDPIVLKIKNTMYIDKDLSAKEKKAVEAHETQHFKDFKALASKMKTAIEQALKAGRDAQMQDRIDWLKYDRCLESADFHRKTAGYSVEQCDQPGSKRPT